MTHLVPDLAVGIAEAREGAEALHVREGHVSAFHGFCLFQIGFVARGLGALEAVLGVGAIAEGFVAGVAATAEGVALIHLIALALLPALGATFPVGDDGLLVERHAAGDHIGSVLGHHHPGLAIGFLVMGRHPGFSSRYQAALSLLVPSKYHPPASLVAHGVNAAPACVGCMS